MQKLAELYAKLKKTKVLAHRIVDETTISFVLASGPKLLMTEKELQKAIDEIQSANKQDEEIEQIKSSKPKSSKPAKAEKEK